MTDVTEVSVVIPAFNEADRLPRTLRGLSDFFAAPGAPASFEIVVSDDGSTDGTIDACERAFAPRDRLRVVHEPINRGKGHAVRRGMLEARGAVRVMCDADGSMPATELPRLVDPVLRGSADVVIGSRYLDGRRSPDRGQSRVRRAWSRFAHAATERLVPGVFDLHCGYKAFRASAAEDVFARATLDRWGFDLEVLALAQRRGHVVLEVPISWKDDGHSRVRARDFPQTVLEVARLWARLQRQRTP